MVDALAASYVSIEKNCKGGEKERVNFDSLFSSNALDRKAGNKKGGEGKVHVDSATKK
jgi:hypothetical protein